MLGKYVKDDVGICGNSAAQPTVSIDTITASIAEFVRISGISRSKIYELLGNGEIHSVCIGARRLIIIQSYRDLLERTRVNTPPIRRARK
jgi:hypothetical protein